MTRLRPDAARYAPAPPRRPRRVGRPRRQGKRLPALAAVAADPGTARTAVPVADRYGAGPRAAEIVSGTAVWSHGGLPVVPLRRVLLRGPAGSFDTQALLCADPDVAPEPIPAWFVRRWQLAATCAEARRQPGPETRRPWSGLAIRRTTPTLLGLLSPVTLLAQQRPAGPTAAIRPAAWHPKASPTFVDAPALLRRELWAHQALSLPGPGPGLIQAPRQFVEHLTETLCFAA